MTMVAHWNCLERIVNDCCGSYEPLFLEIEEFFISIMKRDSIILPSLYMSIVESAF